MGNSWRIMLRVARRDLAKNPGRAALTMALVALPTLVLAAMATLLASLSISAVEAMPAKMGSGAALVEVAPIQPSPGATNFGVKQRGNDPQDASEMGIPGKLWNGKRAADTASISGATDGIAYPVTMTQTRVVVGDRRIRSSALGVDLRKAVYAGTATLDDGRLPTSPNEVLVTRAGASIGIPERGSFTLHTEGQPDRVVTVVGTATTPEAQDLVMLPDSANVLVDRFLIERSEPITWGEVQRLNSYGLLVQSRYLLEHPDQVPPSGPPVVDARLAGVITLLLTGVVLLTALIAGPAFTASGARHRRALGQLASNGATHSMLRRYVLAQAVLLGVIASALAVLIGAAVGLAITTLAEQFAPRHTYGPLEVPWLQLLGLFVIGAGSALIAAVIPAVTAARVDVVSALRGQVSHRKVRAGWPILGLVAAVAGGLILWTTITGSLSGGEAKIAIGAVLLFGGAVMAMPWLMAQVAKAASVLPVSGRMATRDIGRQRSRATSGVAAVMAATALMTALAVAGTSDITQARRDYLPQAPTGEGMATGSPTALAAFARTVRAADPGVRVNAVSTATEPVDWARRTAQVSTPETELVAVAPQCPAPIGRSDATRQSGCELFGGQILGGRTSIAVVDPSDAARMLNLSTSDRAWLAAGNAIALQRPSQDQPYEGPMGQRPRTQLFPESVVKAQGLKLAWDKIRPNGDGPSKPLAHTATVKVRFIDGTPELRSFFGHALVLPTSLATKYQWPLSISQLRFSTPGGLSAATEQRISDLTPDGASFNVERGYRDKSVVIIQIMIAAFALIVLIVTLLGTALAQAESRPDQATLASIGAPRSIRRRIAAGYALVIGFVGSAIGFVVGIVPGIAATWPLTIQQYDPSKPQSPLIDIPWDLLAPALIGVPVIAAVVAVVVTRSNPSITRRQA